jgi:hypothetical protein
MWWPSQDKAKSVMQGAEIFKNLDEDEMRGVEALLRKKRISERRKERHAENKQTEGSVTLQERLLRVDDFLNKYGSFFDKLDDDALQYMMQKLVKNEQERKSMETLKEPRKWYFDADYNSRIPLITESLQRFFADRVSLFDFDDKKPIDVADLTSGWPYVYFQVKDIDDKKHVYFTKDIEKIEEIRQYDPQGTTN